MSSSVWDTEAGPPQFDVASLPLPIFHTDFVFTGGRVSQTMKEEAVKLDAYMADHVEQMIIGVETSIKYGKAQETWRDREPLL